MKTAEQILLERVSAAERLKMKYEDKHSKLLDNSIDNAIQQCIKTPPDDVQAMMDNNIMKRGVMYGSQAINLIREQRKVG